MTGEDTAIDLNVILFILTLGNYFLFAYLNRLAGGGYFKKYLPGRALFWVAPLITVIACLYQQTYSILLFDYTIPYNNGITLGAAFFIWRVFEWGRWFDLNTMPELTRPKKPLEIAIEHISFGSDYIAMFWRMTLPVPLIALVSPYLALLFPFVARECYIWALGIRPNNHVPIAERLCGLLWFTLILTAGQIHG